MNITKSTGTFLLLLLLLPVANAAILNDSLTSGLSITYANAYLNLSNGAVLPQFNTTLSFTTGGVTYLTVPEFSSSSVCSLTTASLQNSTIALPNSTLYDTRSDAFSETGLVLSQGNNAAAFDNWYNTLTRFNICGYGSLPCWIIGRNGTTFNLIGGNNDTASDGSVRSGLALYYAVNNTAFSAGNRSKYLALANSIALDSYRYETIAITTKATRSGYNVTRLPMGGADCAASGIGCSVDLWIGYLGDIIKFYQIAYVFTGNATYDDAARQFTAAGLSVSVQNDTDGDGFGVAPFNFNWNTATTYLNHLDGGGVNSYHYAASNSQWDDSDAPRFSNFCDALRVANLTGNLNGVYLNLSSYCAAWVKSATLTNTTSCLQYYYNGTCATSIRTGAYENGLGFHITTYLNQSFAKPKVDEILTHYSTSAYTLDSSSCGTGGMFRGSKSTKALGSALGYDERMFSTAVSGGGITSPATASPSCVEVTGAERDLLFIGLIGGLIAGVVAVLMTGSFSIAGMLSLAIGLVIFVAGLNGVC